MQMNDSTLRHLNDSSGGLMRMESGYKDSLLVPTMLDIEFKGGSPRKKLKKVSSKRKHGGVGSGLRSIKPQRQGSTQNFTFNKSTVRYEGSESSMHGLISGSGVPLSKQPPLGNLQINLVNKGHTLTLGDRPSELTDGSHEFRAKSSFALSRSQTPSPVQLGRIQHQMHQKQQTQDEIIEDIAKTFDKLKTIFPGNKPPQRHQSPPTLYRDDHFLAKKKQLSRRALAYGGYSQSSNRIGAVNTHQATMRGSQVAIPTKHNSYSQITTLKGKPRQAAVTTGACSTGLQNSVLTSIVPTKRQDSGVPTVRQSNSMPMRHFMKMKNKNALIVKNRGLLEQQRHQKAVATRKNFTEQTKKEMSSRQMGTSSAADPDDKVQNAAAASQPQLNVLQFDGNQIANMNKAAFYTRKVTGPASLKQRSMVNRVIKQQGPIKRLKSAMIRSVFDHGDGGPYGGASSSGQNDNLSQGVLSKANRRLVTKEQRKNLAQQVMKEHENSLYKDQQANLDHSFNENVGVNRGQQVEFPTYAATSPLLQTHDYLNFDDQNQAGNQQLIFSNHNEIQDEKSSNLPSGDTIKNNQITTLGIQETAIDHRLAAPPGQQMLLAQEDAPQTDQPQTLLHTGNFASSDNNRSHRNQQKESVGGSKGEADDHRSYYQKVIMAAKHLQSSAELSSYAMTPENEVIEPRMQVQTTLLDSSENIAAKQIEQHNAQSSAEKKQTDEPYAAELRQQESKIQNIKKQTSAVSARQQVVKDVELEQIQSTIAGQRMRKASQQDVVFTGTSPIAAGDAPQASGAAYSNLHESPKHHIVQAKIKGNVSNENKKKGGKDESKQIMLDSGGNETLHMSSLKQSRVMVSVKEQQQAEQNNNMESLVTSEHAYALNNRFQKTTSGEGAEISTGQIVLAGNSTIQLMRGGNDSSINNRNQSSSLQPGQPDSRLTLAQQHGSMLSSANSTGPQPIMMSKLMSTDNVAQQQYDDKTQTAATGATSAKGYSQLRVKEFELNRNRRHLLQDESSHEHQAISRRRILQQRDNQFLNMLKDEIAEDQLQKYLLTNGQQSGMIKIDPHYMNKALVEKIKLQNQRFQQQSAHNSHRMAHQAAIFNKGGSYSNDFNYGLQEMQKLENSLHASRGSFTKLFAHQYQGDTSAANDEPYVQQNPEHSAETASQSKIKVTVSKDLLNKQMIYNQVAYHVSNDHAKQSRQVQKQSSDASLSTPLTNVVTMAGGASKNQVNLYQQNDRLQSEDLAATQDVQDVDKNHAQVLLDHLAMQQSTPEKASQDLHMRNQDHIFDNARGGTAKLDRYNIGGANQSSFLTSDKKQLSEPPALEMQPSLQENAAARDEILYENQVVEDGGDGSVILITPSNNTKQFQKHALPKPHPQTWDTDMGCETDNQLLQKRLQTATEAQISQANQDLNIVDVISGLDEEFSKKRLPQEVGIKKVPRTGQVTPPSYQERAIKPLQKFVNLNDQTTFAKLQPSIIQRNGLVTQNLSGQQKDLNNEVQKSLVAQRGQSDMYIEQQALATPTRNQELLTFQSLPSSIASQTMQQASLSNLNISAAAAKGPKISTANKMLIHENHSKEASNSHHILSADLYQKLQQHQQTSINVSGGGRSSKHMIMQMQQQTQQPVAFERGGPTDLVGMRPSTQGIVSMSGSIETLVMQNNISAKNLKGVLGQQARFDSIDIEKLTRDRALNRHIHGFDIKKQSDQYVKIKEQAKVLAEESQSRVAVKAEKTMIRQQTAQQRSLRTIRSAMGGRNQDKEKALLSQSIRQIKQNNFLLGGQNNDQQLAVQPGPRSSMGTFVKNSNDSLSFNKHRSDKMLKMAKKNINENSSNESLIQNQGLSQVTLHQYFVANNSNPIVKSNSKATGQHVDKMYGNLARQVPTLKLKQV